MIIRLKSGKFDPTLDNKMNNRLMQQQQQQQQHQMGSNLMNKPTPIRQGQGGDFNNPQGMFLRLHILAMNV